MYGVDLDDELAQEVPRYGWLLDRVLDLPDPYSRFREAMHDDEDMAQMLLDLEEEREDEGAPATLRYSQVGLNESLLISIDTQLKAMRSEAPFLQGAKGKPKYPAPWPMPVSAKEKLRKRRDEEAVAEINRKFGFSEDD